MSVVDDIRARLDIVEVVGETVQLKRAGRSFKGLCPFHTEKTPSFIVTPDRQTWHCFGTCSTGGDVFGFVMRRDNLEFGDTLRLLADRTGVVLTARDPQREDAHARLREALDAASLFFHNLLLNHPAGQVARDYLAKREVSPDSITRFQVGFSLDEWDGLMKHLLSRGFGQAELLEAGLVVEGDRGTYDRFRGRIIYPIRDERGRTVGFGGRALDDTPPKYLNTPQGPMFDKGSILYGLDLARDAIRKDDAVVVVEGYMDVIAAHQRSTANVVAAMGTALTERQIALLKRHSSNIILALDADAAGQAAALRDVDALRSTAHSGGTDLGSLSLDEIRGIASRVDRLVSTDLRVLELPAGQDPDDLLRSDPDGWRRMVANAQPYIEFRFRLLASRADLTEPRARAELAEALLADVGAISQPMVREQYIERLASLTRIEATQLRRQLRAGRFVRPGAKAAAPAVVEPERRDRREEFVLALLFRYPSLRDQGLELDRDLFVQQENRVLFDLWRTYMDAEVARGHLEAELVSRLDDLVLAPLPPFPDTQLDLALRDGVLRLRKSRLLDQKRAFGARLAEIEERSSPNTMAGVAAEALEGRFPTEDDLAEDVTRYLEDVDAGTRLHEVERALRSRGRQMNAPTPVAPTAGGGDE